MSTNISRRRALMLAMAAAGVGASTGLWTAAARAQAKEVKVAVVVPLSGAWARNGELHVKGAQLAVDDINAAGGIKALGGAKMKLIVADSGDSTEKAKNAAQRLLSQETDLVGGTGAFVSSFTLAITEITERAEVPWLTLSYSDQITARGYKYVFQTSPTASKQAEDALPVLMQIAKQAGVAQPKTVGIIMDNTASPVAFTKPMREGGFDKLGLKLVVDEIYTPPLSDATSLVQKVRNAKPDILLMLTTNVPDTKLVVEKLNEMGLGKGRLAVLGNGGHMGAPELSQVVGKELLEGVMGVIANWGGKGQEKIIGEFKTKAKEPWMPQDSISTYGDMWIFKDAMEKAGSADPKKVAAAIRSLDESDGAARYFPGGRLKFEPNGRRAGAELVIVQWQSGEPKAIYPPSLAAAKPMWPKR
jgi:branched-chain amino acid transport system substrate-binding protein